MAVIGSGERRETQLPDVLIEMAGAEQSSGLQRGSTRRVVSGAFRIAVRYRASCS